MGIIGFSFIKFNCERKGGAKGSIDVKHNISIDNVAKTDLNIGTTKSQVLKIEFSFDVLYGSDLGKIGIVGDLIYTDTKEIVDETFKTWESDKKLTETVHKEVYKFIYGKTIVKALELSDALNLPSPIPLPKISFEKKK
jgi:hypothetical protein